MMATVAVLTAFLAVLSTAAAEYPIKGEVSGTFEVRVEVSPGTQVDAGEYAVIPGKEYLYLVMVEKDDLASSGEFRTQPFLVPVPIKKVEVCGSLVKFQNGLDEEFAAYCLNPMGRHPRGEMVVPRWSEIEARCVGIKVVTTEGTHIEERHLTPEWVKAVCYRVDGVVDPKEWKRDSQTIVWMTEAAIPERVNVDTRVRIDVNATVQVNAQAFFDINRSELKELAEAGDEMARQLLEFFSSKEELERMIDTARDALNFVERHLSDVVTAAQTAKEVYETAKGVLGKVPVPPIVTVMALVVLAISGRRP